MSRNMTVKQLGIISGSVALVVLVVWYLALFKPQTHRLSTAHKADAAAQTQISDLHQQVVQLQSLEKEIPADKAKLANYQQAVPADPQLSKTIRSIQSAATNTGVEMTSLAPTVPAAGQPPAAGGPAGAQTIPVTIAANGTYSSLTSFMKALSSMPRTLVVQSVAFGGSGNAMTISISSDMYYTGS